MNFTVTQPDKPTVFSRRLLGIFLLILVRLGVSSALAAPPGNDDFASATTLTGLPVTTAGTNVEATLEAGEPDETEGSGGSSVWWRWTASSSGWVEVNTMGSNFDTVLAVYTGSVLSNLNLVGWNDEAGNSSQSLLKFQAVAGVNYWIQVQGWAGDAGTVALAIFAAIPPSPPVVQRLTLSPVTASVTNSYSNLVAEMEFTASDTLYSVDLTFKGPGGDEFHSSASSYYGLTQISGNPQGGVYQIQVQVPAHRAPGVWQIMLSLEDEARHVVTYGGTGNSALPAGSTTSLTLVNSGPVDALRPRLTAATVTPDPVNVTSGSKEVTVRITAEDDVSLGYMSVSLSDPTNSQQRSLTFSEADLKSGTLLSGVWEKTITIPAFSNPGDWSIRYYVTDNSDRYMDTDSMPAGVPTIFRVQNAGPVDLAGPVVISITSNRTTVDITTASQTVQINATLQDSPAGITDATIQLISPSGLSVASGSLFYQKDPPYPTTAVSGVATLSIPRYLIPGQYKWELYASDAAGYGTNYGEFGKEFPAGFPSSLTVQNSGPADTAPPQLISLAVTPATVAKASLPATVAVTLQASDDVGVEAVSALLASSSNSYYTFPLTRTGGTAQNGTWTGNLTVYSDYPAGDFFIGASIRDVVNNTRRFGWSNGDFSPLPAGSAQKITITGGASDAFQVWRDARPGLAGTAGNPDADADGDGLPNAVEFLLGTDPLLRSQAGGPDPASGRAPVYSTTSTHFRVEYRLSATNAALGSGNNLILQPQSSLPFFWSNRTPTYISGDLWRVEIPFSAGSTQYLRFKVLP